MLDLLLSDVTDRDAQAWAVTVRGAGAIVSGAQVRRVARLIRSLKADGAWSALDRLWLFAAENSTQALIDIRARIVATANGPTFTARRGYTGNGTSAYVDTNFNPTTGTPNYQQNNAGYGVWVYNDPGVAATSGEMGNDDNNAGEIVFNNAGGISFGINSASYTTTQAPSNRLGLLAIERSGAAASQAYQNGATLGTASSAASIAIANRTFVVLATNAAAGAARFTNSGVSAAFIGSSLGATLEVALYARLRTYMTAVGVP